MLQGFDVVFMRLSQNLSLLAELHLTIGIEGYDSMDLSRLHVLSKLLIDNCEFVQLDRTILPKQLKILSLTTWYGLKEHYVLAEQVQDFSTFKVDKIKSLEDQSKASSCCIYYLFVVSPIAVSPCCCGVLPVYKKN